MATINQRFMAKAAQLYYNENFSQAEIAKRLNTSRATVGRALQQALKEGYVRIVFNFPKEQHMEWESQLQNRYGLREVIIAQEGVAKEAALYLARSMKANLSLGITWGRTMKAIVDAFAENEYQRDVKFSGISIVPLTGTSFPSEANPEDLHLSYSALLANHFAELLKGTAYPFPAPLYVRSNELKRLLMQEPEIQRILERERSCDAAVFGIGALGTHSSLSALEPQCTDFISDLQRNGAVGEIMGHPFDAGGKFISNEVSDRIIGISMEDLRNIDLRIAVSYGDEKVPAIHAVCASQTANVLITDGKTAAALIDHGQGQGKIRLV